jgi:hypothetical protein
MHKGGTFAWLLVAAAAMLVLPASVVAQHGTPEPPAAPPTPVPSSEEIQRQREEAERQRLEYLGEKARVDAINERVRRYNQLMKEIPFEPVPGTQNMVQVYVDGHDIRDVAQKIYSVADEATPAGFSSKYWPMVLYLNRGKDYDGGLPLYGKLDPQYPENNVAVFPNVRKQGYKAVVSQIANEDSSLGLQLTAPAVLAYRKRLQDEVVRLASIGGAPPVPQLPASLPGENRQQLMRGLQAEPKDAYPARSKPVAPAGGTAVVAAADPVPVDRDAPLDPAPPAVALREGVNMLGSGYEGYNMEYKPSKLDLQPEIGAIAMLGGRSAEGNPATQPGAYLAFNQRLFDFLLLNESAFVAFAAGGAPSMNGGSLSAGLDVDVSMFNLAGMVGITGLRVVGETEVGPSYAARLRFPITDQVWFSGLYRWSNIEHFQVEERDAQGNLTVGRSGVTNASYIGLGVTLR